MTAKLNISREHVESLASDLPLEVSEVEGALEAMIYACNELYGTTITNTRDLVDVVGLDLLREILCLLSAPRLAEVA